MKIAAFQFRGSDHIQKNYAAIKRGIEWASREGIRFLLTQECALCGYPPVETSSIAQIDFDGIHHSINDIKRLAKQHHIYRRWDHSPQASPLP